MRVVAQLPPAARLMKLKSTLCKMCSETSLTPVERVFFFVASDRLAAVSDELSIQRGARMGIQKKKEKKTRLCEISRPKMSSEKMPAAVLGPGSKFYD